MLPELSQLDRASLVAKFLHGLRIDDLSRRLQMYFLWSFPSALNHRCGGSFLVLDGFFIATSFLLRDRQALRSDLALLHGMAAGASKNLAEIFGRRLGVDPLRPRK